VKNLMHQRKQCSHAMLKKLLLREVDLVSSIALKDLFSVIILSTCPGSKEEME